MRTGCVIGCGTMAATRLRKPTSSALARRRPRGRTEPRAAGRSGAIRPVEQESEPRMSTATHGIARRARSRALDPFGPTFRRRSCTRRRSSGRGHARGQRAARRPHRQAHRPLAQGQVHRRRADSPRQVWWGGFNHPISEERYDGSARASSTTWRTRGLRPGRLRRRRSRPTAAALRAYTETAWASIFADNLFIRPTAADLGGFAPNFTIIDAPVVPRRPGSATARAARP